MRVLHTTALIVALAALPAGVVAAQGDAAKPSAAKPKGTQSGDSVRIERGRYLSKIAGCNDCHTQGYMGAAGNVPEEKWLTGDVLGWRGPWGTTYASNLRDKVPKMSEEEWVQYCRKAQLRPPMP